MQIWVDADSCPVVIRQTLFRASQRTGVKITFVANQFIRLPPSPNLIMRQVSAGFDVADNEIAQGVNPQDLVITNDIPLADEVITKGATALNNRGELLTHHNIKSRLNMRDFMETMRASGIQTKGPNALSQQDRQQFAQQLDKWLVGFNRAK